MPPSLDAAEKMMCDTVVTHCMNRKRYATGKIVKAGTRFRRFIYTGDTSIHAQASDPSVALGA